MARLILALLQRIYLMSSLMLLLVWLIFFMVLIKLLPILGIISGKIVELMVLAYVPKLFALDIESSKRVIVPRGRGCLVAEAWRMGHGAYGTAFPSAVSLEPSVERVRRLR